MASTSVRSTVAASSRPSMPAERGSYFSAMYQLLRYGRTTSPRSASIALA
jgi:hypothetical protein